MMMIYSAPTVEIKSKLLKKPKALYMIISINNDVLWFRGLVV